MTPLLQARLILIAIGVVVWGYGLARDEPRVRVVGMIVLAVSLLLRFAPKLRRKGNDEAV
jgi:hypothetical protein